MEITLQSSFASYGLRPSGNIRKPLPPPKKKKISPHCRLIELLTVNVWAQVVSYLTQNKLYLGLFR